MKHYSKEELELYRNQKMSILRRVACLSHLKECVNCGRLLAELEEDDQLIDELKASVETYQDCRSHDII